ncbi:hypothetical protein PR003_g4238 [Phytophthora rubi]|uniref:DDE-1 domain-containing protein n=1 Tax=Phytophthora rubi TaxID=129364 RepID=A0A6A4FWJ8_9STRA|nr:hypothetical protein PR001_g6004 [Phytophthora rubi]KAE9352699.1 hypothetical protein PR003_g4238 [Phytophthora rubi]
MLEEDYCTQVEFIPPGITGIAQPMDVAVMKAFKDNVRNSYLAFHVENQFPETPDQKRGLISRYVSEAWRNVSAESIRKGFIKSGIIPVGPRDRFGCFRVSAELEEDAPILQDQ